MPRQNRVTPFGTLIADPARGTFMGNRGCLHDAEGRLKGRLSTTRAWICCLTAFKDRRRPLLRPGRYTELFFLDEATALAAGHRPCAECRRADYSRFRAAWRAAGLPGTRAPEIDATLDADRRDGRVQRHHEARAKSLPDGAMILCDGEPALIHGGSLRPWFPGGYGPPRDRPEAAVTVLTPASVVRVLAAGYAPTLHPSLG